MKFNKIENRSFYTKNVVTLAKNLLGTYFVKEDGDDIIAGIITEVEAYDQFSDEASHSFKGKTQRNEVMFCSGGYLYVYFIYGNYFCCNVVADKIEHGAAVLIRSVKPVLGIDIMSVRRFGKVNLTEKEFRNLTNGPAKICMAYSIDKKENGKDLLHSNIYIAKGSPINKQSINVSERIGISKAINHKWRFFLNI